MNKVGFLIGSGASLSAGMPTMGQITEQILGGTEVLRYSDGGYHLGYVNDSIQKQTMEYLGPVRRFLKSLIPYIESYYGNDSQGVNYEELHFLSRQVHDTILREYENPALLPFVEDLMKDPKVLEPGPGASIRRSWTLPQLAEETTNYIHDIVTATLSKPLTGRDHLSFVTGAYSDATVNMMGVFTLNHDTVVDQVLRQSRLPIVDGFGPAINGVRYFDPAVFDGPTDAIPLLKLHGSVDWYRLRPDTADWREDRVGIIEDPDWYHTKTPDGQPQTPMDARPMILIGTYNKVLQYTGWTFSELFYRFHHALRRVETLVVCGYGFGDKGINSQLTQWITLTPKKLVVVIHPRPDDMLARARGAIQRAFASHDESGGLYFVRKKAEDADWQDVREGLT